MDFTNGDDLRTNHFEEGGDDSVHQVEQPISSTLSDPLLIPSGSITNVQAKRFKEALNGLIKNIWVKQMGQESTIVKKDLSIIQVVVDLFIHGRDCLSLKMVI